MSDLERKVFRAEGDFFLELHERDAQNCESVAE
jgi:hypothetical protein